MKVSVVIATYNRPAMLHRTLYSLFRQQDPDYELLVSIDDDPQVFPESEKVCADLQALGAHIRWFNTAQFKRSPGWSLDTYPINVGIRQAQGELIMINTSDVMSVNNTIQIHRGLHETLAPSVVCSTVHALTKQVQDQIDGYDWINRPNNLLFKGSCYKMFCGKGISYTGCYPVEDAAVPYYWQLSVRKHHLEELRGLDEDYYGHIGGCADDDLADRFRRKGLAFYFSVEALAIHQHHQAPEAITTLNSVRSPMSGHQLFAQRRTQSIVRNANHEWGQYPRDMASLPELSGAR